MPSWLQTNIIVLHDPGQAEDPGYLGDRDDDGNLILDGEGNPRNYRAPKIARPAWPEDVKVHIRSMIQSGDQTTANNIQVQAKIQHGLDDKDDTKITGDVNLISPDIVWMAILLKRLECRIGTGKDCSNAFEDPRTRPDYTSENDEGTEGTGRPLKVPPVDEMEERVRLVSMLPPAVTSYVFSQVMERAGDPLPGTKVPTKASKNASASASTKESRKTSDEKSSPEVAPLASSSTAA